MDLSTIQTLLREKVVQNFEINRGNRVRVAEVEGDLIIKYGTSVRAGEGIAMRIVAAQTSIPVPEVISIVEDRETTYVVQRKLTGIHLSEIIDDLEEATGLRIQEQLRHILTQLSCVTPLEEGRQLTKLGKSPVERGDGTVGVAVGGLVGLPEWTGGLFSVFQPSRLTSPPKFLGTTLDLLAKLQKIGRMRPDKAQKHLPFIDAIRPLMFCHGDFCPENILIHDGAVSGIIDWEVAGWYPYFWTAWFGATTGNFKNHRIWSDWRSRLIEPYDKDCTAFGHIFAQAEAWTP
ncbi:kinase-like domain-containing protein [Armillaria novae-zelandiae]|uniref:Kinase-like domain-containing protein n=1 Tax=Armillaria novae-zelandiae TaxID=153914 RepID=A0AA39P3R7_9AGAR|nr:kinase-like domain-containing protein [Armillaria novae-zelandiae]